MVSKIVKWRTPTRTLKGRRHHPWKRSPSSSSSSSSKLITSINKTIYSCKRRLAKIFSKLARIATPKVNSRRKGYITLKRLQERDSFDLTCQELQDQLLEMESICRVLFYQEKLPPLISQKKRTVFLDLDETLVHSKADPPPENYDFIVRPKIGGVYMNFYVLKRPGLDEFLEALGRRKYEVVVFTAGLKEYASLVLDRIDGKGLISHRLYRDSCKEVDGKFVKDLSEMGRDLRKVVIVDDNPNCYCFQPENAIPVKPFVDDLGDGELGKLARFFEGCYFFEDMRDAVKHYVSSSEWEDLKLQTDV